MRSIVQLFPGENIPRREYACDLQVRALSLAAAPGVVGFVAPVGFTVAFVVGFFVGVVGSAESCR